MFRPFFLDGFGTNYLQTILLTNHISSSGNALFERSNNHSGQIKLRPIYSGVLKKVIPKIRQVFFSLSKLNSLALRI